MQRTKGLQLKLERIAKRATASDVAAAMGVTPSRISYLESRDVVTDRAAAKYREALATLPTVATPAVPSPEPAEVA